MQEFVTVEWLMEMEFFKNNIKLLAGEKGLGRKVTFVTVQEAPDMYMALDGGEFILSTWYAFKDNQDAGLKALKNLASKISGVCIKVNRFIDKVPKDYIDFANLYDVPLFVVDKDVKFREIIRAITLEINMSYMNILIQVNDYYNHLFKTALENGSADSMLLDYARRTGLIAISLSRNCKQIRGAKVFQKLPNHKQKLEKITEIIKSIQPLEVIDSIDVSEYHIFPCTARGYCYGYLVILSNDPLTEMQKLYTTQLRNIITIKWLDRQENENDDLRALLNIIMQASEDNVSYVDSKLKERSLDITTGVCFMILRYKTDLILDPKDTKVMFEEAQQFLLDMSASMPNLLFIWNKKDSFTILVDRQKFMNPEAYRIWMDHLRIQIDRYKHLTLSIGPIVSEVLEMKTCARLATNTMIFCDSEHQKLVYYKDFLMTMALLGGSNSKECSLFINEIIDPILVYDQENNSLVMDTLMCVSDSVDLKKAADALCVHVNSIRYRLQKLKQIIGLDFFDDNDKYVIMTAVLMYKNRSRYTQ